MNIKLQLLVNGITETLINNIDVSEITDKGAIGLLLEIQEIVKDYNILTFDAMDKIVELLKTNGFDTGNRSTGNERWIID